MCGVGAGEGHGPRQSVGRVMRGEGGRAAGQLGQVWGGGSGMGPASYSRCEVVDHGVWPSS